jgi:hypothetical protein
LHAPPQAICTPAEGRVLFSESPPPSGGQPPTNKKQFLAAQSADWRNCFAFLLGGFIPPSEFRENNRICKVKMNEIRLKHRSEEIRKEIQLLGLFREYSNVSVV